MGFPEASRFVACAHPGLLDQYPLASSRYQWNPTSVDRGQPQAAPRGTRRHSSSYAAGPITLAGTVVAVVSGDDPILPPEQVQHPMMPCWAAWWDKAHVSYAVCGQLPVPSVTSKPFRECGLITIDDEV